MHDKKLKNIFLPSFGLAVFFVLLLLNSFYSFCWSDEAFYLSTVHRLYNGERILIDEWSPTQIYAPLILPFYSLYFKIIGSANGIYLAARLINVCFKFLISLFFYFSLKKEFGRLISFSAAALYLLYCRANILGFSYYSFSIDFYLLGILFVYDFIKSKKTVLNFFAGIAFALAIISNPFIVVIYVGYSICFLIYGIFKSTIDKRFFFKNLFLIWAGTILCAICYMSFILSRCSFAEFFANILNIFLDDGYGGVNYFKRTVDFFLYMIETYKFTITFIIASAIYCLICILRKKEIPSKVKLFLLVLNSLCFLINSRERLDKIGLPFMALFLFAAICGFLKPKSINETFAGNEMVFFMLPGFFFALIYQWSSDTGVDAMQIGFCVTVAGTLSIVSKAVDSIFQIQQRNIKKLGTILIFGICCSLIAVLTFQRYRYIYRDGRRTALTQKITQGPAKGLFTTSQYKERYDNVCDVMKKLEPVNSDDTIFISSMCPWAYLMLSCKYGSFQTWRTYFDDYRLELYFKTHKLPKYVFDIDENYPIAAKHLQVESGWFYDVLQARYECKDVGCGKMYIRYD